MKTFGNVACLAAGFLSLASKPTSAAAAAAPQVRPATVESEPVISYDGFRVVRLPTGEDLDKVTSMAATLGLETWKRTHAFADMVVPPEKWDAFGVETAGVIGATVLYENLGAALATERQGMAAGAALTKRAAVDESWFSAYHSYDDHLTFLDNLAAQFPNQAEVVTSGTSSQGRNITGIHIYGSSGKGVNPAVVFHGTVHAREWITTLTVEYHAYSLLTNYATDAQTKAWVDQYDFYIFPVVNPDGFVYSQTTDRLWRKNRQTLSGSRCIGVDVNRNWPYQWDVAGGASTDPCEGDYRGAAAGDAAEMAGLVSTLQKIQQQQGVKLYIDWHSYGQLVLTPYGYNCSARTSNDAEIQQLAAGTVDEIAKLFGTVYESGPVCSTLYAVSGGSIDYVQDIIQAQYTLIVELRDEGEYGFVLPADQILATGQEAYEGVKYLLRSMK